MRTSRFGLSILLLASLLTLVVAGSSNTTAHAAALGNCLTAGAPPVFPYHSTDPVLFSTNFNTSSIPPNWWVAPAYSFNKYTVHDPNNVSFSTAGLHLTNNPDRDGTQQDMGIIGEVPTLSTSGRMSNGLNGDSMLMAWCARITNSRDIDTDFELGQQDSRPWPPEIDLAEGAGSQLTVILHWTCDSSIAGCPRTDGFFNGRVAPRGAYSPWPPPGVRVGSHYACDKITNAAGHQVYNSPSDGHFDFNCRAEINLPLPRGAKVNQFNEYGAQFNQSDSRLWVWVDRQPPVIVTDKACGAHLLYDDNGVLPIGQIENGGTAEPCLQASGNWQWDIQQNEWLNRQTVGGLTGGQSDTADVAWWGDYSYSPR
jgi:hypothetical protein